MAYPKLRRFYLQAEIDEHFTLNQEEIQFLKTNRPQKDENFLGMAVFLKCYAYLNYPPQEKQHITKSIVTWIAEQIHVDVALFEHYDWKGIVWKRHLKLIRRYTGYRTPYAPYAADMQRVKRYLMTKNTDSLSDDILLSLAITKYRSSHLELPTEKEVLRLVRSAKNDFLNEIYQTIYHRISDTVQKQIDECLEGEDENDRQYQWIKSSPGPLGMKTFQIEMEKLEYIRTFQLDSHTLFQGISEHLISQLKERAWVEDVYQIKRHSLPVRYTYMVIILHYRQMEITDHLLQMLLKLLQRIEKKAEKELANSLIREIKKVYILAKG